MSEISIHDNIVVGYSVFCEDCEIVLHTAYRDKEPHEQTDVIFRGVEAYYVARDNMHTILFDIEGCPVDNIIADFSSEFETGAKHGWPGAWNHSLEACRDYFEKRHSKGWIISSSYGMVGFVIAESMELRPRDKSEMLEVGV